MSKSTTLTSLACNSPSSIDKVLATKQDIPPTREQSDKSYSFPLLSCVVP